LPGAGLRHAPPAPGRPEQEGGGRPGRAPRADPGQGPPGARGRLTDPALRRRVQPGRPPPGLRRRDQGLWRTGVSAAPEGTAAVLAELRRVFDGSFAAAPADGRAVPEKLLALRLGTDPFAVRVAELRGFERLRHVIALPGASADLLGLTGIRGTLVPVYSLALVMGYPAES